uniref:Uncharacterized protein LOC100370028 n=1 Tax=Saccoglossus kowalevskii TaxID=10224 RepID=A0ABM0MRL7_SACKO|nr:PREDICTED: uncharacterized protein LOC100370028 [Saccoglossus kowalevskii]
MGGELYLESNSFCTPEHLGTHMDAPVHMSKGKLNADEVLLDQLIGPAIRINIKSKADEDPDAQLTVPDLEAWEEENGAIPDDVILMVYSGWGSRWPDKIRFLGTDTTNTTLLHFPGIAPEAAQWLVDYRKIKAVGIDTPSLDHAPSSLYPTHQILYLRNIPGFENVANMDQLPTKGATVFAIPMKIGGGSGAPLRIFATGWRSDIENPCSVGLATKVVFWKFEITFLAVVVSILRVL